MKTSLKVNYLSQLLLDIAKGSMNPDDYKDLDDLLFKLHEHLVKSEAKHAE